MTGRELIDWIHGTKAYDAVVVVDARGELSTDVDPALQIMSQGYRANFDLSVQPVKLKDGELFILL